MTIWQKFVKWFLGLNNFDTAKRYGDAFIAFDNETAGATWTLLYRYAGVNYIVESGYCKYGGFVRIQK